MKKGFLILFVMVMVLFFTVLCFAQQQGPARTIPPSQKLIKIDPGTFQKLRMTVNRSQVINSLMANTTTRGTLYSVARKSRVPVSQLTAKGADGKAAVGNPVVVTPSLRCQDIDYNTGIKFSPFNRSPMCRNPKDGRNVPLGVFSEAGGMGVARGMTSFPDLIQNSSLPLVAHEPDQSSFVALDVLLPSEAATYLVTVHVVPVRNVPLIDLMRRFGLRLIQTIGGWNPTVSFSPGGGIGPGGPGAMPIPSAEIQLAPLSDGSGFVGIISPITDYLGLYFSSKTSEEPIFFSGFTIMCL